MNINRWQSSEKAISSSLNPNIAIITFQCEFYTQFGQQVHIVGNIEELGSWDKTRSIPMITDKDSYPQWKTKIEITCPIGMTIEYKYLVYNNSDYIWEHLPHTAPHRIITMSIPGHFIIINKNGSEASEIKNITLDSSSLSSSSKNLFEIGRENQDLLSLLSYENNKTNNDVLNDTIDFSLSQKNQTDDRIIIATTFLPVTIVKNSHKNFELIPRCSSSITARINSLKEQRKANVVWVGILPDYKLYDEKELYDIDELLQDKGYHMIYPNDNNKEKEDFDNYFIYIHKILFPVFTDSMFDCNNEYLFKNEEYFDAYQKINLAFANEISTITQERDLIIIKDLTLALVPNILIQKNKNSSIGIFIDYPIPSSDIVCIFPKYQEIIKSILLCDVIGFHFFYSARNFLAVLERFFGLSYDISKKGLIAVSYLGRTIVIHIAHGEVDINYIRELKERKECKDQIQHYASIIKNRYAVMAIDHQLYSQSICMKLRAIDMLFSRNKDLIGKVVVFLSIKHFSGETFSLLPQLSEMIEDLKTKYGHDAIIIESFAHFDIFKRLALMSISNILLYPFYYEGHCIFAHEFLVLQNEDKNYGIILGENNCVTANIKSTIKVNAFCPLAIASAIQKCFHSKLNRDKYNRDYNNLAKHSTLDWISSFILDIKRVRYNDSHNKFGMGLGLGFSLIKLSNGFKHLEIDYLLRYYSKSTKRLMFFDYENTLQEITDFENSELPSKRLINVLKGLSIDENNLIFVITKQEISKIAEWFKDVPSIGIAGECGFYYRYPNETTIEREVPNLDMSWKEAVRKVLKGFTERTEGSFIDEKDSSIAWVYKNCDSYFGYVQSNEIKTHLSNIFENKLSISSAEGLLVIKPKDINKGYFLSHIIKKEIKRASNAHFDFIFAVGADISNENVFKYIHSAEKYLSYYNQKLKVVTATIGRKPSSAQGYFNEINELIEVFETLSLTNRRNLNMKLSATSFHDSLPLHHSRLDSRKSDNTLLKYAHQLSK